jgi:hypothetical protein
VSPLAEEIYGVLRRLPAQSPRPRITYGALIGQLPRGYHGVDPNSHVLRQALGEIVDLCRVRELPVLAAIVVSAATGRPGHGYYGKAHPQAVTEDEKRQAWEEELEEVIQQQFYPSSLD